MFAVNSNSRSDYYRYLARLNYEAALAADRKIGLLPGYEIAAPPPVMTLCAHAIELALKSFLLQQGVGETEVKKLRHDLTKIWAQVKEISGKNGFLLPELDEDILPIISDLLVSGRLRYGEQSDLGLVPVFGPLQTLTKSCLELCAAPLLSDVMGEP